MWKKLIPISMISTCMAAIVNDNLLIELSISNETNQAINLQIPHIDKNIKIHEVEGADYSDSLNYTIQPSFKQTANFILETPLMTELSEQLLFQTANKDPLGVVRMWTFQGSKIVSSWGDISYFLSGETYFYLNNFTLYTAAIGSNQANIETVMLCEPQANKCYALIRLR